LDRRHDLVAPRHSECAARAEIELRIGDDQHVALTCGTRHRFPSARAVHSPVMPAKAGIQGQAIGAHALDSGSSLRSGRNDAANIGSAALAEQMSRR
jgi:hypothetical protein